MDAAKLMEYLRAEFGIRDLAEFEVAVSRMKGIDLGIFTMPYKGGERVNEQAVEAKILQRC